METGAGRDGERWFAQLRLLRVICAVLAVLVVAEGLLLARVDGKNREIVDRLMDMRVMADLKLGERPGKLLLITCDDAGFSIRDLQKVRVKAEAWLDDFVLRKEIDEDTGQMLHGILASYLTDYGDTRIMQAVGSLPGHEVPHFHDALQVRYIRTVQLMLGPQLGQEFKKEVEEGWPRWTADL